MSSSERIKIGVGDVVNGFQIIGEQHTCSANRKRKVYLLKCLTCGTETTRTRTSVIRKTVKKGLACSACILRKNLGIKRREWVCVDAWYEREKRMYYLAIECENCGRRITRKRGEFIRSGCGQCPCTPKQKNRRYVDVSDVVDDPVGFISMGNVTTRGRLRKVYASYKEGV